MKKLILLFSIVLTFTTLAQDSTVVIADTVPAKFELYSGAILASRNYARGVNFGVGPSIQPYAGLIYKGFTLDLFAAIGGSGEKYNYGTTHDFSLSYETNGFKIGVHDYYFFSKHGNHNYFFQTASDTMNGHYYEAQVSYTSDKFSLLAGHNFYNTNLKVEGEYWTGVYIEGVYNVTDNFSIITAGLTGPSIVNFYDAAGFTTIGAEWRKEFNIGEIQPILDVKFHVNPNYKNISPGVQQAPINLFASLTF